MNADPAGDDELQTRTRPLDDHLLITGRTGWSTNAILKALKREGKTPADVDLFEINEAFAAVALQSMREIDITDENVNVNGGAIAMGHPRPARGSHCTWRWSWAAAVAASARPDCAAAARARARPCSSAWPADRHGEVLR